MMAQKLLSAGTSRQASERKKARDAAVEVDEKYGFNCRFSQVYVRTILRARQNFRISHCHCSTFSNVMYYYKLVCLFENASLLFYSNSSSAITSCKLENCIVMSAPSGHMIPNLLFSFSSPLALGVCESANARVYICVRVREWLVAKENKLFLKTDKYSAMRTSKTGERAYIRSHTQTQKMRM